jgi:hypothetical protein
MKIAQIFHIQNVHKVWGGGGGVEGVLTTLILHFVRQTHSKLASEIHINPEYGNQQLGYWSYAVE